MKVRTKNGKNIEIFGTELNYFFDGNCWSTGMCPVPNTKNDLYNARSLKLAGADIRDYEIKCWEDGWDSGYPSHNAYAGVLIALNELGAVPVDNDPVPVWGHDI